jgi:L-arabinose isomerase
VKPLDQSEVWFLTGSQELYGEATLRQVAADAEQIARSLGDAAAIPVRVVHKPVLTSAEAIASACQEANVADACVGVIAWIHGATAYYGQPR